MELKNANLNDLHGVINNIHLMFLKKIKNIENGVK